MNKEKTKKNILFITSSLARTGSEILLFNFINFIAEKYTVSVICYTKGDLVDQLPTSVKVHILGLTQPLGLFQKIKRRLKIYITVPILLGSYKNSFWYINTMVLPTAVTYAVLYQVKFILHSHELNKMYHLLSAEQLKQALTQPLRIIANSEITKQQLIEAGAKKQILVINPFIDLHLVETFKRKQNKKATINWLMAGSIDQNKNPQLFLDIANEAKKSSLPYQFIWLYNTISDKALFLSIQQQVSMKHLPVKFVETGDYNNYLQQFSEADGFILTSRSESFSMATLEALALSLQVVVSDCGGVREIANEKIASFVVPDCSAATFIEATKFELGRTGLQFDEKRDIVSRFDKNNILNQWEKLVREIIESSDNP